MNICAMMQPTCAIVASMSPRVSVHHGCETAFPPDAREVSFGPRERAATPQTLNDSSDSGAKSSAGFNRRFAKPCSCE